MLRIAKVALIAGLCATTAQGFQMPKDADAAAFVTSNLLATFYHELGHALIDQLQLPVLGREEDAADTLSALLIHEIWDEDSATAMIYDTANGFWLYSEMAEANGDDLAFSDVHSLDLQRYYNLVCLFYGGNPDVREDVAIELELPEDRALTCPEEFEQASDSWGMMLQDLEPGPGAKGLRMVSRSTSDPIVALLREEVAELNKIYGLDDWIGVRVDDCGEANAFYDPNSAEIILCREYAAEMLQIWENQ